MTAHPVVAAWARDFNNQRRHCWETLDGARRLEKIDWEADEPKHVCDEDHDPKLAGQVEWLRFVHEFGALAKEAGVPSPFTSDDGRHFLLNEVDGHRTTDGRVTYAETYLRANPGDVWGIKPVFRVFLDNEGGWAAIECYDNDLVGLCEQALAKVEASYQKEVPA
jgi:hypothetical protein